MKPPPFMYHRAGSLDEALALLAEHGDAAKPLAGGQSLVPTMNFRLAQPGVLVDLNPVDELAYVREDRGGLRIGAMTRQRHIERDPTVARTVPLLHEAMPFVAHPQIRNRGTLGGSLAHADPAAELPAVTVACGARVTVRGPSGARTIEARDFFTGLFTTALQPGELLAEITFPAAPARSGWAFDEVARRHGDFALAGVAVHVRLDRRDRCEAVRVVFLSVGDGPVLAERAGAALTGSEPTADAIAAAAEAAANEDVDPPGDIHASGAYRRQLVRVLTRRTVTRAVERARTAGGE